MKANELRIGNLLYVSRIGEVEITGLDKIDNAILPIVSNKIKEFRVNFNIISPIPLTEEWLVKFNLKQKKVKWSDGSERTDLFWNDNYFIGLYGDYNTFSGLDYNGQVFLGNINFVHQLQNLYYCLTGKELSYE